MLNSVYICLDSLVKPKILASCLLAYVPVFKKVSIIDIDYAKLLFACAGVVDDGPDDTLANANKWIQVYEKELDEQIQQVKTLEDEYASLKLITEGYKEGYIELIRPSDSFLDGYMFLMPTELVNATSGEELSQIPNLYKRYNALISKLRLTIEEFKNDVDFLKQKYTLRSDMIDSYIRGIGLSTTGNYAISSCNPIYWKWLKQNFSFRNESDFSYGQLSRLVEATSQSFSIPEIFQFIKMSDALEGVLMAKQEYDNRLHTAEEKLNEFLSFLVEEVANLVAGPVLTGIRFVRMITRWDFNKWKRMP